MELPALHKQFEAWARSVGKDDRDLEKSTVGGVLHYTWRTEEQMFQAFCAGRESADSAPQSEPDLFVGHSVMLGGWCVHAQAASGEYVVLRGPFGGQDAADASLARLMEPAAGAEHRRPRYLP